MSHQRQEQLDDDDVRYRRRCPIRRAPRPHRGGACGSFFASGLGEFLLQFGLPSPPGVELLGEFQFLSLVHLVLRFSCSLCSLELALQKGDTSLQLFLGNRCDHISLVFNERRQHARSAVPTASATKRRSATAIGNDRQRPSAMAIGNDRQRPSATIGSEDRQRPSASIAELSRSVAESSRPLSSWRLSRRTNAW